MKRSSVPHLEILGAPIGDAFFCAKVVSQKCAIASKLLSQLEDVGSMDPQVALLLLRQCGGFCKLVHLAKSTPPSLIIEGLEYFDNDVRHCFALSTAVDTTNSAWKQAQLSLSRGGLGLCRLSEHSSACYIVSLSMAGMCSEFNRHLLNAINQFNEHVSKEETVTLEAIRETPCLQKVLSNKLEDSLFAQHIIAWQSSPFISFISPCCSMAFHSSFSWSQSTVRAFRVPSSHTMVARCWYLGLSGCHMSSLYSSFFGPFRPPCFDM